MKTVSKTNNPTSGGSGAPSSVPTPDTKKGLKNYLIEVQREMKKITWPTPAEATRLTSTVVGVCILVAAVLFLFSIGIEKFLELLIGSGS